MDLPRAPHFSQQPRKLSRQFTARTQRIVAIQIIYVGAGQKIALKGLGVSQTLQSGIHEARIAEIAQTGSVSPEHCDRSATRDVVVVAVHDATTITPVPGIIIVVVIVLLVGRWW